MNHYDKIDSALNFIEKNLKNNISVKDVSENSFSSLWHFQRIFRYMTGYSVYSYIRKRRLSEAAQKLILTRSKVIDIAFEFGYETPETFLREFKKDFGTTPSEYMLFTVPGNTTEKLLSAWKYIYGTWLANSEYERGSEDDFEVFDERFWDPQNPVSEIYISIR
ncbi:AraC family transcriptional regulator [Leptospira koniambonensis]|uniref:AraC family transcriptional regulator n=1 Tax=Leptospira koniambonensis TaxID=2484950 RepID=A0A4V6QLS7_9LEPT|nr:AraC family transcriptional regulator [Leptospira koniambonensis]